MMECIELAPTKIVRLTPSKTHRDRIACISANTMPGTPGDYFLSIVRDDETKRYDVEVLPPVGEGLVLAVANQETGEIYECAVGPDLNRCRCSCPGGTAGKNRNGHCIHVLCLREFVLRGDIEHPAAGMA